MPNILSKNDLACGIEEGTAALGLKVGDGGKEELVGEVDSIGAKMVAGAA